MEHVLVTGAGSGLGRAFVDLALADGARVIAVSLLEAELAQLRADHASVSEQLVTRAQDLSTSHAAVRLCDWCDGQGFQIDTLINNAGYAMYGEVVDQDLERAENMMLLNMVTVTKLASLFSVKMKERGAGNVLNVGSTAGMVPTSRFAIYCGTKSYVNTFTVTLRAELASHGVNVTLLTPGAVQTKFSDAAQIDTFEGKSRMKDLFLKGDGASPSDVAAAGYQGMRNGKAHVLAGKGASFAGLISRIFPLAMMPRLLKNA